jgi:phospholipid/cholesterol/gamma-HCH transport system permease protein
MDAAKEDIIEPSELSFDRKADNTLLVRLKGSWTIGQKLPSGREVQSQVESDPATKQITFDAHELSGWDSGLLSFLSKIINQYADKNITIDREGLPEGVRKLLQLAFAVPERKGARRETSRESLLTRIGAATIGVGQSSVETLNFIGEAFVVFLKFFVGKARFQRSELMLTIQQCGAQAFPIVSLISVLIGLILAFIGAVQLMMFGAQILSWSASLWRAAPALPLQPRLEPCR